MLILLFRILFCHHHPITGQRNASCLISNIKVLTGYMLEQFGSRSGSEFFVKNSEYDQKIPQSQTEDKPMAPQGRATQPSRDTRKTN